MSEPSEPDLSAKPSSGKHRRAYELLNEESSLEDIKRAINRMNVDLHLLQLAMREFSKSLGELRAIIESERVRGTVRIERVQGAPAMTMLALCVVLGALAVWVLTRILPP